MVFGPLWFHSEVSGCKLIFLLSGRLQTMMTSSEAHDMWYMWRMWRMWHPWRVWHAIQKCLLTERKNCVKTTLTVIMANCWLVSWSAAVVNEWQQPSLPHVDSGAHAERFVSNSNDKVLAFEYTPWITELCFCIASCFVRRSAVVLIQN